METDDGVLDGLAPNLKGTWFVFNDLPGDTGTTQNPVTTGKLTPMSLSPAVTHQPEGETSSFAMRTWGIVGSSSGNGYAGMGCNLNGGKASYDATGYTGLMFYAHVGTGAAVASSFRLNVTLAATTATADGGTWATGWGVHFGMNIAGLTTSWQAITVTWSPTQQLHQVGFGTTATWNAAQIYGIDFQAASGSTYDIWIDDIYFTK